MFASALISLSASVLITAGTFVSMTTGYAGSAAPSIQSGTLNGLPVTNLPGITVYPGAGGNAQASARDAELLDQLVDSAATQVASSHLAMPYYSFGSSNGQNGKD